MYYIPGMGHGGAEFDAMIGPALDALEAWVVYRESGGTAGPLPDPWLAGWAAIRATHGERPEMILARSLDATLRQ